MSESDVPPPGSAELRAAALAALAEAGLVYLPAHLLVSDAGGLSVGTAAGALPFVAAYVLGVVLACRFRSSPRTTIAAGVVAIATGVWLGRAGWADAAVGVIVGLLVALRAVTLALRDWREPIHASIGVGALVLGFEALLAAGAFTAWRTPLLAFIPVFFAGALASRVVTVWAPVAAEEVDPARSSWIRRASATTLAFGIAVALAALVAVRGGVLERIGRWLSPIANLALSWFVSAVTIVMRPILWALGVIGVDPESVRRALEEWRSRLALTEATRGAARPGAGWSGRLFGLVVFVAIVWLLYRSLRRLRAGVGAFERVDRRSEGSREVPLPEEEASVASRLPFRRGLPSETVRRWYAEALLALRARGLAIEPSLTPAELLPQVAEAFPETAGAFARLTRMYEDVRYGSRRVSGEVVHAFEPEFRRALSAFRRPA